MVEIQCTSCRTRYRLDERLLPADTPTFRCSLCGHLFAASRLEAKAVEASADGCAAVDDDADPAVRQGPRAFVGRTEGDGTAANAVERSIATGWTDGAEGDPAPGDNLTFGFSTPQVGTPDPSRPSGFKRGANGSAKSEGGVPAPPENEVGESPVAEQWQLGTGSRGGLSREIEAPAEPSVVSDEIPPEPGHSRSHSAAAFIVVFILVAGLFGALTIVIDGAPDQAARLLRRIPQVGERFARRARGAPEVALHGVHAEYQLLGGSRRALVISGSAENLSSRPLSLVPVAASLLDGAHRVLASRTVYCGNDVSDKIIAEMTPQEIEFFQGLRPQQGFVFRPGAATPFALVFLDPPRLASSLRISVAGSPTAVSALPASPRS